MTNPEIPLPSHEKIHLTNVETFHKIWELLDTVYPTPQAMTEKALTIVKQKCPEITHAEMLGFCVSYLATMIPQIPTNSFASAITQIATDLIDFHYASLMCEVTGKGPEVLFKLEPTELYYTILEAVTKKVENINTGSN
jgi:hypothetical protein